MKLLITGIDGFLGQHAKIYFSDLGASVVGLSRHHVDGRRGIIAQLGDNSLIHREIANFDAVIHFASPAHVRPQGDRAQWTEKLWRETVAGTTELINWVQPSKPKLIFVSSIKAKEAAQDEMGYAQAKFETENLVLDYENGAVLRLPIVVGQKMKGQLVKMIGLAGIGILPPLPNANDYRPVIDVRDVMSAINALLQSDILGAKQRVWEISDGHRYSLSDISCAIRGATGNKFGIGPLLGPLVPIVLAACRSTNMTALYPRLFRYFEEKIDADTATFSKVFKWQAQHNLSTALIEALQSRETS